MEPLEAVEDLRKTLPADICDKMEGTVQQALIGVIDTEMAFSVYFTQICRKIPDDLQQDPGVLASLQDIMLSTAKVYNRSYEAVRD